jgi:CRP-like cAMP-binding protein
MRSKPTGDSIDPRSVSSLINLFEKETAMSAISAIARQNLLLNQLSDEELQFFLPELETVEHAGNDLLCRENSELEAAYFPCSAVFSSFVCLDADVPIEVGMVGNEGFISIELLLGATRASQTIRCSIPGQSLRMDRIDFRTAMAAQGRLHQILQRASQAYLYLTLQDGACHHWHAPEGRFARLLLETHDRVGQDSFPMTKEFATGMLGIEQITLNQVTGSFQLAGLIRYSRATLQVLDRSRLQEAACECYAKVYGNTRRLIDMPAA